MALRTREGSADTIGSRAAAARGLSLVLLGGVLSGAALPGHADETDPDCVRLAARRAGLGALSGVTVTAPANLDRYLNPGEPARTAVIALGKVIGSARQTRWVHHNLESLRVLFVALFFVSIGMLVDLDFLARHWFQVSVLVVAVFLTNTFVNTLILRMLGDGWSESLYAGALLSQIGEFSFVLSAVGYRSGLITSYGYQLTIATIAITLILSPLWIAFIRRAIRARERR